MSSLYFETSAFVKLLIAEQGSSTARSAWQAADDVACVRLLYAEARAGLAMAHRLRRLTLAAYTTARVGLERRWQDVFAIEATEAVVVHAGDLAEQDALRGYDAIHLASALRAGVDYFACADGDLIRAAAGHGLKVIDSRS
jgi:predicted nucleic acid-binding protein